MPGLIHVFEVDIDKVQVRQQGREIFLGGKSGRFHGRVKKTLTAQLEKLTDKLRLGGWFSAADRDAAAAAPIKGSVFIDLFQELFRRDIAACQFASPRRTDIGTPAASPAFGAVSLYMCASAGLRNRQFRTNTDAPAAPQTATFDVENFRPCVLRIRRGTPQASQGASLHNNQRSNAWAVMQGKAFDFMNQT